MEKKILAYAPLSTPHPYTQKFWVFSKIQDPEVSFIGKEVGQNLWQFMLAGGSAKLVAGFICYPHGFFFENNQIIKFSEVIRTRLREEGSKGIYDLYKRIRWQEGWRTLWRGVLVQVINF